ncbi:MAG TPA: excinuclease ABC subunit UvrC [Acidimicrobiales bacterium]|nr:excinuclease ABC subunit UvrC [Acidimicrobiales bacterium]
MVQRPPTGTIPTTPGSYQFSDGDGRVIYVGKAKNLRSRLSNYFADPRTLAPRTAQMVAAAESVEWIEVRNEVEALVLEYSLIKRFRPRFNVRLIDDKSYPYLAVTASDEWPRPMVMRGKRRKGVRYFGPYVHTKAIRATLDLLITTFPLRTCSDAKFTRHHKLGRPCLLYDIGRCSGPCIGAISAEDYAELTAQLIRFLEGHDTEIVARLESEMATAAEELEFERAARLRDRLENIRKVIERQQMVAERSEDFDVVGIADDDLEAAVQIFHVRAGRVLGRAGFILDKVEDMTPAQLVARTLEGLYDEEPVLGWPKKVYVPELPEGLALYTDWLSGLRGSKVAITVAQRGAKRRLAETVTLNASEEFLRHRLRRSSDHNARAKALNELQQALDLPMSPLRIECYDMSHLQGTDYVGSMVVMEDALPAKQYYRHFKVHVPGNDDFAAMEEVLTRRLERLLADRERPVAERGRFAYEPNLLVIDGGKGQLSSVVAVLERLGLDDQIPVVSLAKRLEEVYVPHRSEPVILDRTSEALYLLQRIRDESHRFAIAYHRKRRDKRMTSSVLDDVPGLGPTRRNRLLREVGNLKTIRAAGLDDLKALSWLPDPVAEAVYTRLHDRTALAHDDKVRR